ncbi:tetratricopeptide repeat protein [Spirillospora sp. NPDC047279]|uniref:tetratricopeptide repeat protein n=1 Tax=Spirillospora sp. NPDC047279 TaxID=3155478 RepID=UPI0033C2D447
MAGAGSTTVVQAMASDGWEVAKTRLARLLGRGEPGGAAAAEERLEWSRAELAAAPEHEREQARRLQEAVWRGLLGDLLEKRPEIEADLHGWVDRFQADRGPFVQVVYAPAQQQTVVGPGTRIGHPPAGASPEIAGTIAVPAGRRYEHGRLHGRDDLIDELVAARSGPGTRTHVLHGLGGGGKSSVALEAAVRLQAVGTEVWWVAATDVDRVTMGMLALARRLGLDESQIVHRGIADLVWQRLEERDEPWALVFDNADDLSVLALDGAPLRDGTGWLRPPRSPVGLVMVTTRHGHASDWGAWCRLHPVGMLPPSKGADLLLDHTGDETGGREDAGSLSERLGGLPLALRLAASFLGQAHRTPAVFAESGCPRTFAQYRAALDRDQFDTLFPAQHDVHLSDGQARQMVGRTWELSLELLERRGIAESRPLLRLLACMADAAIPYELLLRPAMLEEARILPRAVSGRRLWTALQALAGTGLLDLPTTTATSGRTAVLRLHPLVRDAGRPHDEKGRYLAAAASLLARAARGMESGPPERPGAWPNWSALVPHATEVLAALRRDAPHAGRRAWRNAAFATYMSARHLAATGAYRRAEAAYRAVLMARTRVLGGDHAETLNARYGLARMAAAQGRNDEAQGAYLAVLVARMRVLGNDHPDTLNARYGLARVAAAQGRYGEAEAVYREVLAVEERVLGAGHPDTLRSRYGIARMLGEQGRYDEAEGVYRELLAASFPFERPGAPGRGGEPPFELGEARTIYREVLAVEERVVGPDRPDALTILYAIARMAAAQQRYDEAGSAYREVHAVEARTLGPDHPDTLTTRHWIARMAAARGRHREAEAGFQEVLAGRERVLGRDHPSTLTTRHWIARVAAAQGRRREAAAALRTVLEARRKVLGVDHPHTRRTREALEQLEDGPPRSDGTDLAH